MSFDKYYPNRKDWRKPYRKSKAFDRSCRTGGDCAWCKSNRLFKNELKRKIAEEKLLEFYQGFFEVSVP